MDLQVNDMSDMEKLLEALAEVDEDIDFAEENALIDDGLVDSLTLTQIIAALSDTFDVYISTRDMEPENFNSVQGMLDLVHKYQERS